MQMDGIKLIISKILIIKLEIYDDELWWTKLNKFGVYAFNRTLGRPCIIHLEDEQYNRYCDDSLEHKSLHNKLNE